MRAKPLLQPRPVPHNRLCAEESDSLAASGDGGLGGSVGDVEDGKVWPPPVDLGYGYVGRVGADHQALGADSVELQGWAKEGALGCVIRAS